jgi:hypothetical protein
MRTLSRSKEVLRTKLDGPKPGEVVYLRRVYITRKEYRTSKFFMCFTMSGSIAKYVAAENREAAKRFVSKQYPHAKFWK